LNQADLRQLALKRVRDAKALIDGGRWEFAYYVAGYAVECALKSCVLARMIHTGLVFEDKFNAKDCLTHDLKTLVRLAGLQQDLDQRLARSVAVQDSFHANWGIVNLWTVTARYVPKTEAEAKELFQAITDRPDGVLRWLRNYW
jgi:hypothetical protein